MVMRSQNSNSKWVSQKYTQENGEGDWNQYQVVLTGGARKLRIRDSDNTSTNLATTWPVLEAGQKVILTTDYSTFANETIGSTSSVGSTTPSLNLSNTAVSGLTSLNYTSTQLDSFITYSTDTYSNVMAYGGMADIHPEGTRAWFSGYGGVITEYVFSTPWDASTATASGNTFTSPESIASWSAAAPGFTWADDGRLFIVTGYPGMTTTVRLLTTYRASTPYDLGSLDASGYSTAYTYIDGNLTKYPGTADQIAFLKMSRDGTKFVAPAGAATAPLTNNSITMSLNSPFNLSTIDRYVASNTTYVTTGLSNTTYDNGVNMTHNGRFVTKLHSGNFSDTANSRFGMRFDVYSLTDPWDISTLSITPVGTIYFPSNYNGTSRQATGNTFNTVMHGVSPCGRYLVYTAYYGDTSVSSTTLQNRLGIVDLKGIGWDLGDGVDVDITNHGLSSAPVAAWTQAPKIYVSAETSSARCAVDPVSLAYWKDSSTTSTLVIGSEASGILTAGDTLLLNDTDTVTISDVVESADAYTPIIPACIGADPLIGGRIFYTGRTFDTNTSDQTTTIISSPTFGYVHGKMWMSPDGVNLYVTSSRSLANGSAYAANQNYSNMLVRYKLATPWNIDTATWVQTWDGGYVYTEATTTYRGQNYHIASVIFNPAGTKLIAYIQYSVGSSTTATSLLQEWNLGVPWDLNTCSLVDTILLPSKSNYSTPGQMTINSNGTQLALQCTRVSTSGTNQRMVIGLNTPWSISGASIPAAWSSDVNEQGGIGNFVTKNGKYIIHSSDLASTVSDTNARVATVQTLLTPDDISNNSVVNGSDNNSSTTSASYVTMYNTTGWRDAYTTTVTPGTIPLGYCASEDGTKLYIYTHDGVIRQFDIRLNDPMYKYTVTIPTQGSVPTTVTMPARVSEMSFTSIALDANDSDVLVLSTDEIAADSSTRAIQFKIEENAQESLLNSVKINLWRG